ncbi:AraC family transcriptional regulator [Labrys miyagiensis]|uniref:AraC family transcriptional regulator n=1 Tax=Labrys miyagiensis TaxID=346912 RepID=A0ABQ6CRW1_9HYPH|nr:AraC family transcriptional regulator [Labrys miyagiensis]GLS23088.1 AraC family transcriptional regulator [Labrys miyagiensis]
MPRSFVAGIEAVEAESSHSFPRHTHDQFGVGFISRGAQKSASGRGLVEAGAGNVITVNPGEVHDGIPIGGGSRRWHMLYLDPAVVAAAIGDIEEGRKPGFEFTAPVLADRPPLALFRRLFRAVTQSEPEGAELKRDEALLLLLARMRGEALAGAMPPAPIARARDLIDSDPAAPVTLSDLAVESGLSQFQVVRGFARATGMTPHAYLMQCRIHLARRLIVEGMALAEVAAASGFADQSHMTRRFVRVYGVSPGAYAAAVR